MKRPVVHFLLAGVCLLLLDRGVGPRAFGLCQDRVIEIGGGDLESLRLGWRRQTGALPTDAELDALVERRIDDEILFREARRLGLHQTDSVVRRRLVRNMRFAGGKGAEDESTLLRAAYALEMDASDVVVRRRLIQAVAHRVEGAAAEPTEAELRRFFEDRAERFRSEERLRFEHVFVSSDRRGQSVVPDAIAIAGHLRSGDDSAFASGDPFLHGSDLGPVSRLQLGGSFGVAFASELFDSIDGEWVGPIESPFGLHVVRILERIPSRVPSFDEARAKIRDELMAERRLDARRSALEALRARYEVRVSGRRSE